MMIVTKLSNFRTTQQPSLTLIYHDLSEKLSICLGMNRQDYNQKRFLKLMEQVQRIFVTGAARGLGFDLVKLISKKNPAAQLHVSSRVDPELLTKKWELEQGIKGVKCYKIDLNDSSSIATSVQSIKQTGIVFDFIVANAAFGCDYGQTIPSVETASNTLKTNVTATIDFVKQFLPILSKDGRVVLVSSFMGALSEQPKKVQELLNDSKITEEQISNFVDRYIRAAEKKEMPDLCWSAYRTSKALLNAWGRFVLPNYLKAGQTAISLHPGWCQTDMGGKNALLTSEQGASRIYEGITIKEATTSQFYNTKYCNYFSCQ